MNKAAKTSESTSPSTEAAPSIDAAAAVEPPRKTVGFQRSSKKISSSPFAGQSPAAAGPKFSTSPPPTAETPAPPAAFSPPKKSRRRPSCTSESAAFPSEDAVQAVGLHDDQDFWGIFDDVKQIGKGHFAKVKLVEHISTQESFACKVLDKSLADNDIEDMVREFQMLRSLRHTNIIRLFAAYETPRKLYLVTELAEGGELMKRIADSTKVYSEDICREYVGVILNAVKYMHEKNCVHRDLKPENVLLSDMTDDAHIKIVDLGLSRFFDEQRLMRTICGTHKYLAPELIKCDRGQAQGYDKAIDMWGVGLLAYIMLFGFNPFARGMQSETHQAILDCEWTFPEGYTVSAEGKDFISSLMRREAKERLSASAALAHGFVTGEGVAGVPTSPEVTNSPLLSGDRRPVKALLGEFNAQRMLSKMVKGAHRRLGSRASDEEGGPA